MFFQLSLPSTPPAADAGDELACPELQGAGTLTVPALPRASRQAQGLVGRIRLATARGTKASLRFGVTTAATAAVTYTAEPGRVPADDPDTPLQ